MSRRVELLPEVRACAPEFADALQPVHLAETDDEREAIYRFRYGIYTEELGRKLGGADHDRRRLHDPEDDEPGTLLFFTTADDGSVSGTIRVLHWPAGTIPEAERRTFSMERFAGIERLGAAELGRLMVRPTERGTLGLVSMVTALYQLGATEIPTDLVFGNCATGLLRHYRRLGVRTYDGRLVDTPDGVEVPFVLVPGDREQLERSGSFLAPLTDALYGPERLRSVPEAWREVLDADGGPVRHDSAAIAERVERVRAGERQAGFLEGLGDATTERLSEQGFLLKVNAGQLLTEQGLTQQELFVILDGAFEVRRDGQRLRLAGPGEVIGEIAFFGSSGRRTASVSAVSDGEVLVLRRHFVDDLREREPAVAAEILFALARALADRVSPS